MKSTKWPAVWAILIFTCLGLFFLKHSIAGLKREKYENTWPHAVSTVMSTKIVESYFGTKSGKQWCPVWTNEYLVDERKYRTDQQKWGTASCFKRHEEAEEELEKHPVGSKLQVIFEPSNPGHAVIEIPAKNANSYWFVNASGFELILGLALISLAVFGIISNLSKFRADGAAT